MPQIYQSDYTVNTRRIKMRQSRGSNVAKLLVRTAGEVNQINGKTCNLATESHFQISLSGYFHIYVRIIHIKCTY